MAFIRLSRLPASDCLITSTVARQSEAMLEHLYKLKWSLTAVQYYAEQESPKSKHIVLSMVINHVQCIIDAGVNWIDYCFL